MIEGFRLKVTSVELAKHCLSRALYHRRRAEEKSKELPGLKEAIGRIKSAEAAMRPGDVATMSKGSNIGYRVGDPVGDLERDIRDHSNKALVFDFFSDHLFDEDYDLGEEDLVRLEILRDR